MARITVEDCVEYVPNRFELVVLAARRVQQLFSGSPLTIPEDNDKAPVLALREIALHKENLQISPEELRESIIRSMRTHMDVEETGEDIIDLMEDEITLASTSHSKNKDAEDSHLS